jgi:DNA-directed RNA polymerase subunit RPC12/RpoP
MIRFRCSKCGKLLGIDDSEAGKWTRCAKCKQRVLIPMKSQANTGGGKAKSNTQQQVETEDYEVIEDFEVIEEGEKPSEFEVLEEVESLEEVEDLDEIELVDEEEEEVRPRRKKSSVKGNKRKRRDEEEEEDEESFFTRNRITGIGGLVLGPAFLVFGIVWHFNNEYDLMLRIIIMALGGLITLAGLFYVIKG